MWRLRSTSTTSIYLWNGHNFTLKMSNFFLTKIIREQIFHYNITQVEVKVRSPITSKCYLSTCTRVNYPLLKAVHWKKKKIQARSCCCCFCQKFTLPAAPSPVSPPTAHLVLPWQSTSPPPPSSSPSPWLRDCALPWQPLSGMWNKTCEDKAGSSIRHHFSIWDIHLQRYVCYKWNHIEIIYIYIIWIFATEQEVYLWCVWTVFSDSVMLLHALCCKLVNLQESVSAYICTCVQCKIHLVLLLLYYFQNFFLSNMCLALWFWSDSSSVDGFVK